MAEHKRPRVYISGPITKGDRNHNFYQSVVAEKDLMLSGFAPLNPMPAMTLPFAWDGDINHELWLERDFAWIEVSDAILRLPGYSVGADAECQHANKFNVPIFYDMEQLIAWKLRMEKQDAKSPDQAEESKDEFDPNSPGFPG